jgi:hypothetical protein
MCYRWAYFRAHVGQCVGFPLLRTVLQLFFCLVTLLIPAVLLIVPTVFHVLINGHVVCLKFTRPSDCVDDQFLGRSPVLFPGSHVVSRDTFEAWR